MTVDTVKTDSLSVNSHSIFAFLGGQSTRNGQKILMRIIMRGMACELIKRLDFGRLAL
jgi:hypothetical protein